MQFLANYHPYDFTIDKLLPINIDGFQFTSPSKSFPSGINNLYDMGGNSFEFVLDTIWKKSDYHDMNLVVTPDSLIRIVRKTAFISNFFRIPFCKINRI